MKLPIVVILLSLKRRSRRNSNHYAKITVDGYGETFSICLSFGVALFESAEYRPQLRWNESSIQACRSDNKSGAQNVIKIIITPSVIDGINSIWPLIISIGNCTSPFDMLMNA